jgi:hypothetical protein
LTSDSDEVKAFLALEEILRIEEDEEMFEYFFK